MLTEPLSPPVLHILLALSNGPRHGYGILQAVREQSAGAVRLGPGSLYRHLSTLIDAGWIDDDGPTASGDPRRGASYRLTAAGRQTLVVERRRLSALVTSIEAAERRLRRGSA
jgi:DNA-binding PadR family transcriptional regulator